MLTLFAFAYISSVWLIGGSNVCGAAMGGREDPKSDCVLTNCEKLSNDIGKAECCGNQVCTGAELCCGGQAFNPEEGTCCEVDNGHNKTAVTKGLSQKVSSCCGLKAYNELNDICCESNIAAKPGPNAKCCGKVAFDVDKQLCCGPKGSKKVVPKTSTEHRCCGYKPFNLRSQCCCTVPPESLKIESINSPCCQSALCGEKPYNISSELCCDSTVVNTTVLDASCCGKVAFDKHTHLCCGPHNNKTFLQKDSSGHVCCGHKQYNPKTECCHEMNGSLEPMQINSSSCVQNQKPSSLLICKETTFCICGSKRSSSCDKNQPKSQCCCTPERYEGVLTVYDPSAHICCDGCVTGRKPWKDQCFGQTSYCLAQSGVLCRKGTLYKYRDDGEVCSAGGTHPSPEQHYCGRELYLPEEDICCHGQRHANNGNSHCCGGEAYNISDPKKKCCAARLYNLTGQSGEKYYNCCGSLLQNIESVCCSSEFNEVLYSKKGGFGCCGHQYFNASLWSCCAGRLSPAKNQNKSINESKLLSINNLNESDLCNKMQIGTVDSVSLNSIVFRDVLEIHGRNATMTHLALPHILKTPDCCSFPKLTPGKIYFFDGKNVFADFIHDSVLQSLYFIFSKCYGP
ncbi:hypothetical protein CgunFtcFv8_010625 [Champsocephalus gunnari]|uniref:Galaxin-like repeats domain-containing protein n=1 Tax=Champsocephalus gunnari TaxID=52237 RepID=A0AAN8HVB9_CHAGU|nr:hypothetical protein CgunFtcFv8_010625 [Champsocephalus gunnari]